VALPTDLFRKDEFQKIAVAVKKSFTKSKKMEKNI